MRVKNWMYEISCWCRKNRYGLYAAAAAMALCLFAGYMRGSADGYQRGYEEAGKPQIKYVKTYLEHTYIGNYNSELFHSCYCSTLPYPDKRIYFDDREVAVSLGYKPCQNCNP